MKHGLGLRYFGGGKRRQSVVPPLFYKLFLRAFALLGVVSVGIAATPAQAAPVVGIDGATCVPGTYSGFNINCTNLTYYNYGAYYGGLAILPQISNNGTRVDGVVDDSRYAFTTGTSGYGKASADLATGQLKVTANSIEGTSNMVTAVRTWFGDGIHLTGPTDADGTADGFYTIDMSLSVHGNRATDFTNAQSFVLSSYADLSVGYAGMLTACENGPLFPNLSAGNADAIDTVLHVSCTVPADFNFSATLASGHINDGFFDFGSTANLSLQLPTGVSYASDSGVLLTQPVPLPAAGCLFGSGLMGLVGVARRKKTA